MPSRPIGWQIALNSLFLLIILVLVIWSTYLQKMLIFTVYLYRSHHNDKYTYVHCTYINIARIGHNLRCVASTRTNVCSYFSVFNKIQQPTERQSNINARKTLKIHGWKYVDVVKCIYTLHEPGKTYYTRSIHYIRTPQAQQCTGVSKMGHIRTVLEYIIFFRNPADSRNKCISTSCEIILFDKSKLLTFTRRLVQLVLDCQNAQNKSL